SRGERNPTRAREVKRSATRVAAAGRLGAAEGGTVGDGYVAGGTVGDGHVAGGASRRRDGAAGPALETVGLEKSFGALRVAQGIDFCLPHGARHALIGPNGAGKTT